MSRFDYDDGDSDWTAARQALEDHNIQRALNGRKGQALLRELEQALLALPTKRLTDEWLDDDGAGHRDVCIISALAVYREMARTLGDYDEALADLPPLDDPDDVAAFATRRLGIVKTLGWYLQWVNDEGFPVASPEERWARMLAWVRRQIAVPSGG